MANFLDPVFYPILKLPPFFAVLVVSIIITLIVTIIYKYTTNQKLMKELKDKLKDHQKEMKQHQKDPKKMMEVNRKMMEVNLKYMTHSFRSMIFTILPVLLIFTWFNTHLAYHPIHPGEEFTTSIQFSDVTADKVEIGVPTGIEILDGATKDVKDKKASWTLKGSAGEYLIEYKTSSNTYKKDIIISNDPIYAQPVKKYKDATVQVDNKKLLVVWKLNWLWTYLILSIGLSALLRKILNVY